MNFEKHFFHDPGSTHSLGVKRTSLFSLQQRMKLCYHFPFLLDTNLFPSSHCPHIPLQPTSLVHLSCKSMSIRAEKSMTSVAPPPQPVVVRRLPVWLFWSDRSSQTLRLRGWSQVASRSICYVKRTGLYLAKRETHTITSSYSKYNAQTILNQASNF